MTALRWRNATKSFGTKWRKVIRKCRINILVKHKNVCLYSSFSFYLMFSRECQPAVIARWSEGVYEASRCNSVCCCRLCSGPKRVVRHLVEGKKRDAVAMVDSTLISCNRLSKHVFRCVCVRALSALPFLFQPRLSQCFPLIRSCLRLPFLLFVSSLKMNLAVSFSSQPHLTKGESVAF